MKTEQEMHAKAMERAHEMEKQRIAAETKKSKGFFARILGLWVPQASFQLGTATDMRPMKTYTNFKLRMISSVQRL